MKNISSRMAKVATISGLVLGAFVLSALAAWTPPSTTPPNGNVAAPVNIDYDVQTKQGGIILNSLDATAGHAAMTYGLWVINAPIRAGGGLIIETRTTDPSTLETGRMWLRTDL